MSIQRICVFCGSHKGKNPDYIKVAQELGHQLASCNIGLVFGGGSVGIMGTVADAALASGGKVQGVIPEQLVKKEIAHDRLMSLHITRDMHERKAMMEELSDAFITLPGGFGTFEELFETITWSQLGIHQKPIVVINVDGYFDPLIEFVEHAVEQGFILNDNKKIMQPAESVNEAFELLGIGHHA